MKTKLKDFLAFSKGERRGIFVLLSLIMALLLLRYLYPLIMPRPTYDHEVFRREVEAFEKERVNLAEEPPSASAWSTGGGDEFDYSRPEKSAATANLKPFPFDPNKMDAPGWQELGLTPRQVKMLLKYTSKGGVFRCKGDFGKMYCISPEEYAVLEPYIQLPVEKPSQTPAAGTPSANAKKEIPVVEINTATAEELKGLPGIGDYFAQKIIAYRSRLGGYYRKEQLLEVNKMDSSRFRQIGPYVEVNTAAVRRMNVNTAGFEELSAHPYIGYNIALSLTNYRKNHGAFEKLPDIRKSALVTEAVYQKISPYLKVE